MTQPNVNKYIFLNYCFFILIPQRDNGPRAGLFIFKKFVLIITLVNPYLNVKVVFKDVVFKSLKPKNLPMLRFREHFWATKEKSGRFVRAICRLFVVVEEEEKRGECHRGKLIEKTGAAWRFFSLQPKVK